MELLFPANCQSFEVRIMNARLCLACFKVVLCMLLLPSSMGFSYHQQEQKTLAERMKVALLTVDGEAGPVGFVISGWTPDELAVLSSLESTQLPRALAVAVHRPQSADAVPALAGKYEARDQALIFLPRYAPMPGTSYEVRLDPAELPVNVRPRRTEPIIKTVTVPKPDSDPAMVSNVFPSGDELPENLLKFYIHFSAPMSVGDSYQYVSLHEIRADGARREIELPFLTLEQELWDQDGTRLTLLFDPGRIKRGLKPREEEGPALEEGKSYEFVVSAEWPDAHGEPLADEHRKRFRILAPDDIQPRPAEWQMSPPMAETRDELTLAFEEPLDHAMLNRVIRIRALKAGGAQDEFVGGEITISAGEKRWGFVPETSWTAGDYEIVVETTLEDRAGNSIGRPFEVDIFNKIDRGTPREYSRLRFTVVE